jgi:anaerobic magnesium-protoporphyrin IX monomethyl ester cyclase
MTGPSGPVVALVYPYFRYRDPVEKLFPPLGIAYLASQLKRLGISVLVADCTFETFEQAIDLIAVSRPAIVGFSIMVTMSRNAFEMLKELRKRLPNTLFIAGGPLPSVHPAMFGEAFDLVFCGECDTTFPSFCRDYLSQGRNRDFLETLDPASYPGIYINAGGRITASEPRHNRQAVLDRLPLPDRSVFDHERYQAAIKENTGLLQTSLIVTRGCPFACDFCSRPVFGNVFRKPTLEKVFSEIDEIVSLGYDTLWVADDCFTLDTTYLADFCTGMIDRGVPVNWTCLSRIDRIDADLVGLMKRAGCIRVYLGLESGSDETLKLMNKQTTVRQGIGAVDLFHRAGIGTAGFFMVGYPGETRESIEKTFRLALSLPLDEAWFTVPLPLPGTPLFSRVAVLEDWEDWETSNQVKFVFPTEFDEQWIRSRINETLHEFQKRKRNAPDECPTDR